MEPITRPGVLQRRATADPLGGGVPAHAPSARQRSSGVGSSRRHPEEERLHVGGDSRAPIRRRAEPSYSQAISSEYQRSIVSGVISQHGGGMVFELRRTLRSGP